jgi:hypothetical protein
MRKQAKKKKKKIQSREELEDYFSKCHNTEQNQPGLVVCLSGRAPA